MKSQKSNLKSQKKCFLSFICNPELKTLNLNWKNREEGQAMVTILFFMMIALTIISAAATVIYADNLSATTAQLGQEAYYIAESGAEDGVLYALRNRPSGATVTYDLLPAGSDLQAHVSITNSGSSDTILSVGEVGNATSVKKIKVVVTIGADGTYAISSWKEVSTH